MAAQRNSFPEQQTQRVPDDVTHGDDDTYVDTRGAGERMGGFSPITLAQWRMLGKGPAFTRVGRCIRYRVGDIRAYLVANRVGGAK